MLGLQWFWLSRMIAWRPWENVSPGRWLTAVAISFSLFDGRQLLFLVMMAADTLYFYALDGWGVVLAGFLCFCVFFKKQMDSLQKWQFSPSCYGRKTGTNAWLHHMWCTILHFSYKNTNKKQCSEICNDRDTTHYPHLLRNEAQTCKSTATQNNGITLVSWPVCITRHSSMAKLILLNTDQPTTFSPSYWFSLRSTH